MEHWRLPSASRSIITCVSRPAWTSRHKLDRQISTGFGASRSIVTYASRPACSSRHTLDRQISTGPSVGSASLPGPSPQVSSRSPARELPPLSVMPTPILVRALLMTSILSSPLLVKLSLPIMDRIAHSNLWLLNPDKNPVLHMFIRKLVYDHFCAGENEKEIKKTISTIKGMGFEGVILGYGKETVVDKSATAEDAAGPDVSEKMGSVVTEWKEGNLRTLHMLSKGDFLAVKFTGAGPLVTSALAMGKPPPPKMLEAMKEICDQAALQGTRLWIDAEQQVFQTAIDAWTTDLMRNYNRDGNVLVYNTFQAYLKGTPQNIAEHLKLAQSENWTLGIKLVRGAYIASEPRHLIHDTIENTHAAYNSIVRSLLEKEFPGVDGPLPNVQLMLASHNAESVTKGYETWKSRREQGLPTIKLEIGQLQGMADEISCGLVKTRQEMTSSPEVDLQTALYPRAFKCLCWGGTQQCIQFLMRRVIENRGSLDRTKLWMSGLRQELWRRIRYSV